MPVATGSILGIAIPDGRFTLLVDMLLLLVAAALGSTGFQVARAMSLIRLGTHLDQRLQAAVWDRVVRLRTGFFRQYSVGDLVERVLGIDTIRRILTGATVNAVIGGVFSLASLAIMLIYDASLTGFAVLYGLLAGSLLFVAGRAQRRLQKVMYDQEGLVSGLLIELLGGIAKLRVAAAELRAFARWSDAFAQQRVASAGVLRMKALQTITTSALPFIGTIGIFYIAGGGADPLDVASFAAFNSAFGQFTAAILSMANALNTSIDILPLWARVRPVFEAPLEVERSRVDPGELSGQHRRPRPVVPLQRGRPVGGGERRLRAEAGREHRHRRTLGIGQVDGAAPAARASRRRRAAACSTTARISRSSTSGWCANRSAPCSRGPSLLPGSLYENIAGSAPLTPEQVMEAVRLAGLEADVAGMPMGLNSVVTEGASQISGGQRQRVMIARALVRGRACCSSTRRPARSTTAPRRSWARAWRQDERLAHRDRPSAQHHPRCRPHLSCSRTGGSPRPAPTTS